MVRRSPRSPRWWSYFPHTRGDGPAMDARLQVLEIFSPHAWGWSGSPMGELWESIIFPTRVGMVRVFTRFGSAASNFPHTRGDGPSFFSQIFLTFAFSPHAWGWSEPLCRTGRHPLIFPTRVGMVRARGRQNHMHAYFPHTRGDGPRDYNLVSFDESFSPHAWGWSAEYNLRAMQVTIFPTRVGMVRRASRWQPTPGHFPHTRGDGPA